MKKLPVIRFLILFGAVCLFAAAGHLVWVKGSAHVKAALAEPTHPEPVDPEAVRIAAEVDAARELRGNNPSASAGVIAVVLGWLCLSSPLLVPALLLLILFAVLSKRR